MGRQAILDLPEQQPSRGDAPRQRQGLVRVLHVVNGEHYAGAERVQDLLALRLPEFGFDVDFVCLKPGRFAQVRQSQQSRLWQLPMRSRFDLRPVRQLARQIRDERYALVHTHTPRAAFVGRLASAWAGVPLVHHVHSPTNRDTTHPWRNRVNTLTERLSLCRVAAVIAVSHSLGKWACGQGLPQWRIAVVPNGVPVSNSLKPRLPPTGEWTLGMVALFRPRKGLEVLLEALAQLRASGLDVRLRAVGSFETEAYQAQILRQVEQLQLAGAIDWIGFTSNVAAELERMDLFVLPSLFGEGLPMVVLEAMAAGVPVVASDVEGVPEVIRDGCEGLLVEPGNAAELAAALSRVVADVGHAGVPPLGGDESAPAKAGTPTTGHVDWLALRYAACERQRELFSDRSMAQGVANVYRQVLERETRP